jgi:hypothetical protein
LAEHISILESIGKIGAQDISVFSVEFTDPYSFGIAFRSGLAFLSEELGGKIY